MATKTRTARGGAKPAIKTKPANQPAKVGAKQAQALLAACFRRNGYLRLPIAARVKQAKATKQKHVYKKGYELRLVANSTKELREIQSCLGQAGYKFGKAYAKSSQFVVPVYGKQQIDAFLTMVKTVPASK